MDAKLVSKLLNCWQSGRKPAASEWSLSRSVVAAFLFGLVAGGVPMAMTAAWAQDTAAQEAAHRATVLAGLPADAAKRVFGAAASPAPGAARAIGGYTRGCLAGAAELPADGPNWQVMRPSRNRAWGHPVLIAILERLAVQAAAKIGRAHV